MDEHEFAQYLLDTFDDVQTTEGLTYRFFFAGEERRLPFATMALDDAEYDRYSDLARPGVYV